MLKSKQTYQGLILSISEKLVNSREKVVAAVNHEMVIAYWHIGKYIVDYEQSGSEKSLYGSQLLQNLSKDLSLELGKGFSRSNLNYMRQLFLVFPKSETLSHKLSWFLSVNCFS